MRENGVKRRLRNGQPSLGTWLSLPCPEGVQFLSQIGFDWLTVDTEHQPIDVRMAAQMFAAVVAGGAVPLARVPWNTGEAIKRVLSAFDLRYDQLPPAFEGVAGPAVRALNAERLRQRPRVGVVTLGRPHPAPRHSVIVPLYGRIDFLEYQAALFARHGLPLPEDALHDILAADA